MTNRLDAPHARGLRAPKRPPRGTARVPSSKSQAIRALLVAALPHGDERPRPAGAAGIKIGPLVDTRLGADVRCALAAAAALGAEVERGEEIVRVLPWNPQAPVDGLAAPTQVGVGESGTLARCVTAIAALRRPGCTTRIEGAGTLARRSSPPLFRALRAAGAEIECEATQDGWPCVVRGAPAAEGARTLDLTAPMSSQEVTALLLALDASRGGRLRVQGRIPSEPYVGLTLQVLRRVHGECVQVARDDVAGREFSRFAILPAPPTRPAALQLEPDASLAAVVLGAACLSGGELAVTGFEDSVQSDLLAVRLLADLGCDARHADGALSARGRASRGGDLDLYFAPDAAPVLAAVAADAALRRGAVVRLGGLDTLAGKESDRLAGIERALRAVGATVERREMRTVHGQLGPALEIRPGGTPAPDLVLDPEDDHRMAYLHALLGLVVPGVSTRDGRCVEKTWPGFWEDMEELGFEVVRGA